MPSSLRQVTRMLPDELTTLRTTYPRFLGGVDHPDIEQVAYGAKRLTAFLVGSGAAPNYIEQATRDFVDTCLGNADEQPGALGPGGLDGAA